MISATKEQLLNVIDYCKTAIMTMGKEQTEMAKEMLKTKNVVAELSEQLYDLREKDKELEKDLNDLRPRINELECYQGAE